MAKSGGYFSSGGIKTTSVDNEEVIPSPPADWRNVKYNFKKFSFENEQACNVKINGSDEIYLKEGYGFDVGYDDPPIRSLVIVESGIEYQWFATM